MNPPKTIFCDIDGTLVQHKQDIIKNIYEEPVILPNVIETIKLWDKLNYKIILTTGRKESTRVQTEIQLAKVGIVYDQLIMGITNGDRILINDKKLNGVNNTCYAINLVRNQGFNNVDVTSSNITIPDKYLYTKLENPWGYEELIEYNDKYVIKKLFMKTGNSSNTQYHELKTETIIILSGKLIIYIGEKIDVLERKEYSFGDTITIKPYTIYKMEATEDCLYLETSTNELWDVIQL
jgi:mannose-6-phosphate isomerase